MVWRKAIQKASIYSSTMMVMGIMHRDINHLTSRTHFHKANNHDDHCRTSTNPIPILLLTRITTAITRPCICGRSRRRRYDGVIYRYTDRSLRPTDVAENRSEQSPKGLYPASFSAPKSLPCRPPRSRFRRGSHQLGTSARFVACWEFEAINQDTDSGYQ